MTSDTPTVDEARDAYEAALEAASQSAEAEAVQAAREALATAIYDDAVSQLKESYSLVFVDYDDQLSAEEVAALVKGDMEKLWALREEWESDSQHHGARYVIEEIVDKDDLEILRDSDRYIELESDILDRDRSTWLDDVIRHTSAPLLRINCIDEDAAFSFQPVEPALVLDAIGFEHSERNVEVMRNTLLECSPEFSVLMGYWLCVIDLKVLADCPADGQIRVKNPILYLGNPFSGSGFFDEPLEGEVVIERSEIRTDKDAFGYSIDEIFGLAGTSFAEVKAEIVGDAHGDL